ncbi:hypothetical protein SNEBB_007066 [Seison nebaliae]|nr:hypothetical protein SNEBB_007066 [Seison nebaliae]
MSRKKLSKKNFRVDKKSLIEKLLSFFGFIEHFRTYHVKTDLLSDIVAGVTVGIMVIPQGMAYGMLASLRSVNGLYLSFFSSIIYFIFGGSQFISLGPIAILALLTASSAEKFADAINDDSLSFMEKKILVASSLAFVTGIIQVGMSICKLGFLATYLSDPLVSGFTTGASVHVLVSQIKSLMGISVQRRDGIFKVPLTLYDILCKLDEANVVEVFISMIALIVFFLIKEYINKPYKSKLPMPIPSELIVVIIATIASTFLYLNDQFGIKIVGAIPYGLPAPTLPSFLLMPQLITNGFIAAIISYAITYSMAVIFAKQTLNKVPNANNELIAYGLCSIGGAFFQCFPAGASLSRSSVQRNSGAKSQLSGIIAAILILCILMFMGKYFYALPKCILAAIIVFALKGMFRQILDFIFYFKANKYEGTIWLISCLSVILVDVDYGLFLSFMCNFVFVVWQTQRTKLIQYEVEEPAQIQRFSDAIINNSKDSVTHLTYKSPLYFANCEKFRDQLNELKEEVVGNKFVKFSDQDKSSNNFILLDFSGVNYVDTMGIRVLANMKTNLEKKDFQMICFNYNRQIKKLSQYMKRKGKIDRTDYLFDEYDKNYFTKKPVMDTFVHLNGDDEISNGIMKTKITWFDKDGNSIRHL